ncbi:MAG TPA: hypothetical protein VGM39_07785 [Kofleriaceae bacterium]|jgi:hypothetical protein
MRLALAALVILGASEAYAYRPFEGTDADTAGFHEVELEFGPLQLTHFRGDTDYTPNFVFNYGFARGFELVVDLDGTFLHGSHTVGSDVVVKGLIRGGSLHGGHGPSIALETGVLFPTLPRDSSDAGWVADLIVSQRWTPLTLHLNLTSGYDRDRSIIRQASLIAEGPEGWRVRPVAEVLVDPDRGYILGGAIWQAKESLAVDAAVVGERMDGATGVEVRLGVTAVL